MTAFRLGLQIALGRSLGGRLARLQPDVGPGSHGDGPPSPGDDIMDLRLEQKGDEMTVIADLLADAGTQEKRGTRHRGHFLCAGQCLWVPE